MNAPTSQKPDAETTQHHITARLGPALTAKALAKIVLGITLPSKPLLFDGWHGLVGLGQHGLLVWAGRHSRRQDVSRYPIGRGPLVDVAGLILGLVLFYLIGLKAFLAAVNAVLELLPGQSPIVAFVAHLLPPVPSAEHAGPPLVAGIVMLLSGAVSHWLRRFEHEQALSPHRPLREFIAESHEIGAAAVMEIGLGVGLLAQAGLAALAEGTGNHALTLADELAPTVILGVLGARLAWLGLREAFEYATGLLNPALDRTQRAHLEQNLRVEMPSGCALDDLEAYRRADEVFITGYIGIPKQMMHTGHYVLSHIKHCTEEFLKPEHSHVVFTVASHDEAPDPEAERCRLLAEVWRVDPASAVGDLHRQHRLGQASIVEARLPALAPKTPEEQALAAWLTADIALLLHGARSAQAEEALKRLTAGLPSVARQPSDPFLAGWLLICATDRRADPDSIAMLRVWLDAALRDEVLPPVARAEAAFALAYGWERDTEFDLTKARDYYRSAEQLMRTSGYVFQADRLLTTWGHHLTLVSELVPGIIKLEEARRLREVLQDEVGLGFVFGCLADAYGRLGEFELADDSYERDVVLCERTGTARFVPGVRCKQGEARIRRGVTLQDPRWVARGIDLCRQAEATLAQAGGPALFFARKGQAKGHLALAHQHDGIERGAAIEAAAALIDALDATTKYERAFTTRLRGRLAAATGDYQTAVTLLRESGDLFSDMRRREIAGDAYSLQSIVSLLESGCVALAESPEGWDAVRMALSKLDEFFQPLGGLLGSARTRILELRPPLEAGAPSSNEGRKAMVNRLDRLVGFLEG